MTVVNFNIVKSLPVKRRRFKKGDMFTHVKYQQSQNNGPVPVSPDPITFLVITQPKFDGSVYFVCQVMWLTSGVNNFKRTTFYFSSNGINDSGVELLASTEETGEPVDPREMMYATSTTTNSSATSFSFPAMITNSTSYPFPLSSTGTPSKKK